MDKKFERKVVSLSNVRPQGLLFDIDGETFESVPPSWWGAAETLHARRHLQVVQKFETAVDPDNEVSNPTEDDLHEYEHHLREYAKMVIPDCPPHKINDLHISQVAVIARSFLLAVRQLRQDQARQIQAEMGTQAPSSNGTSTETISVAS